MMGWEIKSGGRSGGGGEISLWAIRADDGGGVVVIAGDGGGGGGVLPEAKEVKRGAEEDCDGEKVESWERFVRFLVENW